MGTWPYGMEYQVVEESALVGWKSFLSNPVDGYVRVWRPRNTTFQQEHIVGTTAFGGGGFTVWGCFSLNCKIDMYVIDWPLRGQKYRDFLFNFAYSLLRAIVLPVAYFWINTWSFLVVWVILYSSIKSFVVCNCRFFHTFEKNILVTVKNWWSLTYGQVYILWKLKNVHQIILYMVN